MSGPVKKKPSQKQQIRLLLNTVARLEKNYAAARTKKYAAQKAVDDAWKELDAARMKTARAACPFKKGQIVKHWKSGYAKITEVADMITMKPPYFVVYGVRVKADLKTAIDKKAKLLNASDWEAIEAKP
jgi:chromosome segregation ATPase